MMAVDILPASIPLDASQHFSKVLGPYLESLITFETKGTSSAFEPRQRSAENLEALDRATIARNGELAPQHQWLRPSVDAFHASSRVPAKQEASAAAQESKGEVKKQGGAPSKKNILLLGSGMVAKPTVDMIAERGKETGGHRLVIGKSWSCAIPETLTHMRAASNALHELQSLAAPHPDVSYRMVDMSNPSTYGHLIQEADVVIS